MAITSASASSKTKAADIILALCAASDVSALGSQNSPEGDCNMTISQSSGCQTIAILVLILET
jgi:hypothetical protein